MPHYPLIPKVLNLLNASQFMVNQKNELEVSVHNTYILFPFFTFYLFIFHNWCTNNMNQICYC